MAEHVGDLHVSHPVMQSGRSGRVQEISMASRNGGICCWCGRYVRSGRVASLNKPRLPRAVCSWCESTARREGCAKGCVSRFCILVEVDNGKPLL